MKFYGKDGQIELEVGKIYHAMKPVINSVWTASFTVVEEEKIYLITYDRDNPIGYDREAEFYLHVKEDDKRNIIGIRISEDSSSHSTRPSDEFEVVNSRYIFSYDGPKTEELKMFPSLKWLATQTVAKKFGLGENENKNKNNIMAIEKVLMFDEWSKALSEKKEEKTEEGGEEKKEEKNPLVDKVGDLSTNMNDTVTFEKPKKLEVEDKVWHIVAVTPDKAHRGIKVTYKEEDDDKEKKVNFFDFHKDAQQDLYDLLKKSI
jgi:hypothetical protein